MERAGQRCDHPNMKAAIYTKSSDVVQITDVEKPIPHDDEVLIRVRAASVNPLDSHLGKHAFLRRILKVTRPGRDVAGEVEAAGSKVTQFKRGDRVFGACRAAFAEYACASESNLAAKPDNVTFEQAASVPVAALTALQGLRDKGRIQPGQQVLINGAAGGVGTFAVQIARSFGANVTGVCSTRNVEMVQSIGAAHVIDYSQEDFTKSGQHYDLIFDLVSNHSLSACRRVLHPRGIYIGAGALGRESMIDIASRLLKVLVLPWFISQKLLTFTAKLSKEDLSILSELMATGRVRPVIDRCYSLSEVAEAIRYLGERHARGKVVITLEADNKT